MTSSALHPDDLRAPPAPDALIAFPDTFGTRFMLVIDTEEEFDWGAPFGRDNRSVTHFAAADAAQRYFAAAGVRPLWVVDYPVIDDARAGAMLAQWQAEGGADIGAHCHPWVNPPHTEEVNEANSFAGNLPEALERAKITVLRDRIVEVTGKPPVAFRAGRYGVGPNTGRILRDLGFRVDTSVRSRFDYSAQHGPDFGALPLLPWRAGPDGALIELPLSTAYVGPLAPWGGSLQPVAERLPPMAGAFARTGLFQRVPLTPEGVTPHEATAAVDRLIRDGLRLLMFSFHSPTLAPGNTPYVRSEGDLRAFYRWWDVMLAHLARRRIASASLDQVLAASDRHAMG